MNDPPAASAPLVAVLATPTFGKARQRKLDALAKWQVECLNQIRRRMPPFLVTEPLPIELAGANGNMGHVNTTTGQITIAPKTYRLGEARTKKTIKHELVHVHVARYLAAQGKHEASHGPTFQKVAYFLGIREWGEKNWKWKYTCRKCGYWIKSHTKYTYKPSCKNGHGKLTLKANITITRKDRAAFQGTPAPEAKPAVKRDLVAERAARARSNLATWERKQKLANTKVKAWRKKVAYYERKAT